MTKRLNFASRLFIFFARLKARLSRIPSNDSTLAHLLLLSSSPCKTLAGAAGLADRILVHSATTVVCKLDTVGQRVCRWLSLCGAWSRARMP